MNLQELQSVQNGERTTDSLQHLRETFYEDVAAYIEGLREERSGAATEADDPFDSPTVRRLTDEIKAAEDVVEAIYERRVGKIVKRASIDAAGMPTEEDEGLTKEEAVLFDDLVERIEENKGEVLDVLAGKVSAASESSVATPETSGPRAASESRSPSSAPDDPSSVSSAGDGEPSPAPTGESTTELNRDPSDESVDGSIDSSSPERTTVRITRDVGEIFGVDEREYVLEAEDVVSLPSANAEPLVARDAAEKLK